MLSEFVQAVVSTCTITDYGTAQAPPERGKKSLFFDLQGPIDLLGPEEVEDLLSELTSSDAPVAALENLSSDVHLLEDLCFGPTWPQLCDALGRLVCLPGTGAAAAAAAQPQQTPSAPLPLPLPLPRQQQLLLAVLQELASSVAASSPPHAAELLDALAPHLTALVLRLALRPPSGGDGGGGGGGRGGGGGGGEAAVVAAPDLLAAAAALDAFAVGLMRVAHRLLAGLAAEFHMLPPGCAALAARAVCDVVRAGLARGAPALAAPAAAALPLLEEDPMVVDLSALDLLVLLDPELRWWQRLCAATHATQPLADAVAATHLAAALEAALQAWAAAAAAAAAAGGGHSSHGGALAGGVGGGMAAGGRSPTHLLACTALLGGLVRANSPVLLGCAAPRGDGDVGGGGDGTAAAAAAPKPHLQARPAAAAAVSQQQRLRLQRMLGHLLSCFCMASDKPWLFRANSGAAKAAAACATDAGNGGQGGSVFLLLAADVLSSAASLGKLSLLAPAGASGGGAAAAAAGSTNTGGIGVLTSLLQAMLRAAALTAGAAASGATASTVEVEAWLTAAARVLAAASEYAAAGSETTATATGASQRDPPAAQPAAADAMCALLRHIAGRVRGCAAAAASAAPAWALPVLRGAAPLAAASSAVSGALRDLYDTLHAALSARQPRRAESVSPASPQTRMAAAAGSGGRNGGNGGGGTQLGPKPRGVSLIDILDSGGTSTAGQEQARASPSESSESRRSSATEIEPNAVLDDLELLAAEAVMSYCRTDFDAAAATSAGPPPAVLLQLPTALRRPLLLECAARLLCEEYDEAGGFTLGAGGGVGSGARGGAAGGLGVRRTAAKRGVARRAEALARCCLAGQQALVAAGFARRVLDDVAAVLRSGEYDSPYLEPLPYADSLAGLAAILSGVLCWPGLLRLPEQQPQEQGQGRSGGGEARRPLRNGGGETAVAVAVAVGELGVALEQRCRQEVLALLQELVTWLDPRGAEGGGLPAADAAAVSLRAFASLVASDPSAGAALERDTNIRWYLQSLCGTLPPEGEEEKAGEAAGGRGERRAEGPCLNDTAAGCAAIGPGDGGKGDGPQPRAPPPQSDLLLDLARAVLQATTRATAVGAV